MPPALRRSVSSPSVRVAPYQTSSSYNSNTSSSTSSSGTSTSTAIAGRPRRGASDASGRRVLADIEWWRVMQGQREGDDENVAEPEADDDAQRQDPDAERGPEGDRDSGPAPPLSPRTPEPPASPLYTVSEDTDQPEGTSSTDSTPTRAPSLPPIGIYTAGRPRPRPASRSLSLPGLTFAALRLADDDTTMLDAYHRR